MKQHRPHTHPVLVKARMHRALEEARPGHSISATASSEISTRIEDLAQRVVLMPDTLLTDQQRRSLRIIASELIRRSHL